MDKTKEGKQWTLRGKSASELNQRNEFRSDLTRQLNDGEIGWCDGTPYSNKTVVRQVSRRLGHGKYRVYPFWSWVEGLLARLVRQAHQPAGAARRYTTDDKLSRWRRAPGNAAAVHAERLCCYLLAEVGN